jgi:hypothetical protein
MSEHSKNHRRGAKLKKKKQKARKERNRESRKRGTYYYED